MDSGGWKTGVGQLCKEAGRGKNYLKKDLIPKVMSTPDDGDPFARAERSDKGVPTKLTPRKDEAMKEKALEWGFDFSYEEMADALMELFDFTITRQAIADHLRNAEWNVRACQRAEPMLRDVATTRATTRQSGVFSGLTRPLKHAHCLYLACI